MKVRRVDFSFFCDDATSGSCFGATWSDSVTSGTRTTVSFGGHHYSGTTVPFSWTDTCVDPGYYFEADFYDSKGHLLGTVDTSANPYYLPGFVSDIAFCI